MKNALLLLIFSFVFVWAIILRIKQDPCKSDAKFTPPGKYAKNSRLLEVLLPNLHHTRDGKVICQKCGAIPNMKQNKLALQVLKEFYGKLTSPTNH
jgi:hypothetical protein